MAFLRREGARNVGQGADHFGEHGEGPEEEGLNGRGRIFRRSEGGQRARTGTDYFGEHIMTCILKDMRQGEGSNGRGIRAKVGNKGHDISEDLGMKFWRPVVRGRGGRKHGTCILENMGSGYFVGQREEKCEKEEQCVQNRTT